MESLNTSGIDILIFVILLGIMGFVLTRKKK